MFKSLPLSRSRRAFNAAVAASVSSSVAAAMLLCAAAPAAAADSTEPYPNKPVHLIVPVAPGGTNDLLGRLLADKLGAALNQKFIVENRTGGAGAVGVGVAAKAPADGYTLLISSAGPLVINIDPEGSVDPSRDLAPITVLVDLPYALVGNSEKPFKDVGELVSYSNTKPTGATVAYGGGGSDAHLLSILLKTQSKGNIVPLAYPGAGPAINDILGGHVDALFTSFPAVTQLIAAGKVRPLAVASKERWAGYPDVPTFAEKGIPNVYATAWFGVLAPAKTPAPILDRLNQEIARAFKDPAVVAELQKLSANPRLDSRADSVAFIASERAKWQRVIKDNGIKLN